MFAGGKREYFVEFFCEEMAVRFGACSLEMRADIEQLVDKVLANVKANGLDHLDRPLGKAVQGPNVDGEDRQSREFGAHVRGDSEFQWIADGVTPGEVREYWDHGLISHLCYGVLDSLAFRAVCVAAMQAFSDEGRDFGSLDESVDAAAAQARMLWPCYGPITGDHLQWDERDRPLPPEARLWVDQWPFQRMSSDAEAFLLELSSSSSFNAAARRARAADPQLSAALKRAGMPAPAYGLPPLCCLQMKRSGRRPVPIGPWLADSARWVCSRRGPAPMSW